MEKYGFNWLTTPIASSQLINIGWNNDLYPNAPTLDAHSNLTVMDIDGPGMITQIHATNYALRGQADFQTSAGSAIIFKVYYDHEITPSIDMPLMDFLGDCECGFRFYATRFFSKVKHAHNAYLSFPFQKHIRITFENISDFDLSGYATIQYDLLQTLPEETCYLKTDYRKGTSLIPKNKIVLFDSQTSGSIVAHWLKITGNNALCANGEYLCEANTLITLSGGAVPSMEYLGTEDYYGYSWGFHGNQSDGSCAIVQEESTCAGGATVGMLRCREQDAIRYRHSCHIEMDYSQEYFSTLSRNPLHEKIYPKIAFEVLYSSCYYYYEAKEKAQ